MSSTAVPPVAAPPVDRQRDAEVSLTASQLSELKQGRRIRIPSPELGGDLLLKWSSPEPATSATVAVEEGMTPEEQAADEAEKAAWAKVGLEAASAWAKDNDY